MLKNWRTSLAGAVGGIPQIVVGILTKNWEMLGQGVAVLILGLVAGDGKVVDQSPSVEGL